jgi:hypothetical protein
LPSASLSPATPTLDWLVFTARLTFTCGCPFSPHFSFFLVERKLWSIRTRPFPPFSDDDQSPQTIQHSCNISKTQQRGMFGLYQWCSLLIREQTQSQSIIMIQSSESSLVLSATPFGPCSSNSQRLSVNQGLSLRMRLWIDRQEDSTSVNVETTKFGKCL